MTFSPAALNWFEILAALAGVAYVVLAARRNRLCWIVGAVSSAFIAVVTALSALPMQASLNVFYVGMSAYGWWSWKRSSAEAELPVGLWPYRRHLGAALALMALSFLSARWLAAETDAAWPLLDSLTTWFSLLATWLQARALLENWLYWIAIDAVLVFLFYARGKTWLALLNISFIGIATAGFIAWRRNLKAQPVPA
ncbi:MAG: nicotinamide riboside transporter PnuC [Pseudomonadota bacterium]